MIGVSQKRLRALLHKEWSQVRRDPMTLRLIIRSDHAIVPVRLCRQHQSQASADLACSAEHSKYERTLVAALQNTGYCDMPSEAAAEKALASGDLLFRHQLSSQFRSLGRSWRGTAGAGRRRCHLSLGHQQCDRGARCHRQRARSRPAAGAPAAGTGPALSVSCPIAVRQLNLRGFQLDGRRNTAGRRDKRDRHQHSGGEHFAGHDLLLRWL
jgi:hypothetical protein